MGTVAFWGYKKEMDSFCSVQVVVSLHYTTDELNNMQSGVCHSPESYSVS